MLLLAKSTKNAGGFFETADRQSSAALMRKAASVLGFYSVKAEIKSGKVTLISFMLTLKLHSK